MNDSIRFIKAGKKDLEILVSTRILVLKAANLLKDDTDMSIVEAQSRIYYSECFDYDTHVAYLVYDQDRFVGSGGVSFFKIMPTYHNPSGLKAYIMNMYTDPEYRRQGIAKKTLDLLVGEARERDIGQISLEAAEMGKPLYLQYGFKYMKDEMELRLE